MSAARLIDITIDDLREIIREELRASGQTSERKPGNRLSVPKAAKQAGVSPETLRTWIHEGRVPFKRAGREFRVLLADVEAAMVAQPMSKVDVEARTQAIIRRLKG